MPRAKIELEDPLFEVGLSERHRCGSRTDSTALAELSPILVVCICTDGSLSPLARALQPAIPSHVWTLGMSPEASEGSRSGEPSPLIAGVGVACESERGASATRARAYGVRERRPHPARREVRGPHVNHRGMSLPRTRRRTSIAS
jgi:hypothetical protein